MFSVTSERSVSGAFSHCGTHSAEQGKPEGGGGCLKREPVARPSQPGLTKRRPLKGGDLLDRPVSSELLKSAIVTDY